MSDFLEEDDEPSAPFWMSTFSDMVTLLLTFFVMIVAMSEVEVKKFKDALSYFQGRTSVLQQDAIIEPPTKPLISPPEEDEQMSRKDQAERYEALLQYLEANGLTDMVQVDLTEQGLHVVMTDSVMFRSGQARLIEPSRTVLQMIGGVLGSDAQSVVVEGHTDDRPISTAQFPSNWELSAARASSVVRFLQSLDTSLEPSRYMAVGYGEFHPRDTNQSAAGRARNRRVEILFSWEPWPTETNPYLKRLTAQSL